MNADLTMTEELALNPVDRLAAAARSAGGVAKWSLTLAAATLFGTALSVVMGVATVVVAALAVVCVLALGVVVAAALLLLAAACVVGAALALVVGTLALLGTALLKLSSLARRGGRSVWDATLRLGRGRSTTTQVTSSSS